MNPRHQLPEQNLEEGTETGIPEAHHRTPVYSKDSRRTDPLHRSPGRGKKEACLIGWEERSQLHPHVLIVVGEVPKQKELKLKQEGVNKSESIFPWTCEERNPFTPRIRHFSLPRTRMPSHVKTYDGSGDPEDHLKFIQSAAKIDRWLANPTWCHCSTYPHRNARVGFDKLPKESIDSYARSKNMRSGKLNSAYIKYQGSVGGYITHQAKRWKIYEKTSGKDIRQKSWSRRSAGWHAISLGDLCME
ncbi:hypothetical protein Tco_0270849 [Tanacetum coccineum]